MATEGALAHAARLGVAAAMSRYGVKQAGFNPHVPIPVPRPGVLSSSSTRAPAPAVSPPAAAGPSILDRGRAVGQQVGGAASRLMRSATRPLALMGVGALGASMLHHGNQQHDDGRLAYSPLPGSFIQ